MINDQYPNASRFAKWALKRSKETFDATPILHEGKLYQETCRQWNGNIGAKAASIYEETGNNRLYLINDEFHQVWIEKAARYVSEYGALRVGEVVFSTAKCGRCQTELSEPESAKINACEDCITAVLEEPEAELEAWSRGEWGQ